jgi:hypothetical protein
VQVTLHVLGVIRFEGAILGLVEQDDDGHDLAGIHLGRAQALSLSCAQQVMLPARNKLLPEIVYGTKQVEYTHNRNLLVIDTAVRFVLSYQERFPYPELTLKYLLKNPAILMDPNVHSAWKEMLRDLGWQQ